MKKRWLLLLLTPLMLLALFFIGGALLINSESVMDKVIDYGLLSYTEAEANDTTESTKVNPLGGLFWLKTCLMLIGIAVFAHYFTKFVSKKPNGSEEQP